MQHKVAMDGDEMKQIQTTIEIDATPDEVWGVLVDFDSHADWNPFFSSIEGSPVVGQQIKIRARKPDGSPGMGFTPTILDVQPGSLLRWKGKLLVNGIFDGEHVFELAALAGGRTRLDHGEVFTGILIPLMGKVLKGTEAGFNAFNSALADEVASRREADCQ